jgi:hypothetical protein
MTQIRWEKLSRRALEKIANSEGGKRWLPQAQSKRRSRRQKQCNAGLSSPLAQEAVDQRQWVAPKSVKPSRLVNPANEEVLTLVAAGDKADVDQAVEAACALTVARPTTGPARQLR